MFPLTWINDQENKVPVAADADADADADLLWSSEETVVSEL